MRSLRDAEARFETAKQERARVDLEEAETGREHIRVAAALDELRDDPANRDARRLAEAEEHERRAQRDTDDACTRASQSQAELEREQRALDKASADISLGEADLASTRTDAEQHATKVGLDGLLADLDEHVVNERLEARDRQVLHLRERTRERDGERRKHERAQHDADTARGELDRAVQHRNDKQHERDEIRGRLERDLATWIDDLEVLQISDASAESLFEGLVEWSERGEGEGPINTMIARAHTSAVTQLSTQKANLEGDSRALCTRRDALQAEHDKLKSGRTRPPPAPQWRDGESRATRDGAPLWSLCDFAEHVTQDERVGFEAALEAAGLLDAWITPDGRVLDVHDAFLRFDEPLGRSLAEVLVPAIDQAEPRASLVDESTVMKILASIGAQPCEGQAWVASDGRFSLGPMTGRGRKNAVEHIGHGAREQARRRRLEAIAAELAELAEELARIEQQVSACKSRLEQADRERGRAPLGTTLRDAARELAAAELQQHQRSQAARHATELEQRAAAELRAADDRLREDAEQFGLSAWLDALTKLEMALSTLRRALDKVWAAQRRLDQLQEARRERDAAVQRASETMVRDLERQREAEQHLEAASARHAALRETIGDKVEELQRKISKLHERRAEIDDKLWRLRHDKSEADKAYGAAEKAVEERGSRLGERERERGEAIRELQALARTGVWASLDQAWRERGNDPDWVPTTAIEIARELEKLLQTVDSGAATWDRVTSALHRGVQELISALSSHGFTPTSSQEADVLVVTIMYQGRPLDPSALAQTLDEEIVDRERILNEREREILENHLIVDVAHHLHNRIREGERLVASMNHEIANRPLSTGMRFRFKWAPHSEPELMEARKRLLAAQGAWSPEDRKAIGRFLQRRIQDERESSETGTWADHLTRALDYRDWHEFEIERWQHDSWTKLTKKTYGTGSGGEKAIALTLPQLAAASAHYSSAGKRAPRLILMDEAFVGVDSDMRAKCMGLLAAFDLDFVMTSEREWGCYDTVPALAIYQLVTRPGVDAVHETRWVWNGRERVRDVG